MNTADAHLAGAPCARQISTMPAAMVTGKVPAWIQPRQVGFSSAGWAGEASSSGMFGSSGPRDSSAFTAASAGGRSATGSARSSATSSGSGAFRGVMEQE